MQIFLTMPYFYLPIKFSASYLRINTVFSTPIIQLILHTKCYISREYSHKFFLTIENFKFYDFLVKNVVFHVIFVSVFFSMLKYKNNYWTYETLF